MKSWQLEERALTEAPDKRADARATTSAGASYCGATKVQSNAPGRAEPSTESDAARGLHYVERMIPGIFTRKPLLPVRVRFWANQGDGSFQR